MGLDIRGLVEATVQSAGFTLVANNPLAQFGTEARNYKLASILPEQLVPLNDYVEEGIQYRTVIANNGSRYSPVQKKGSVITGSFKVSLAKSDIGSEFSASDYDAFIRLLQQSTGTAGTLGENVVRPGMIELAQGQLLKWSDMTLNRPLLERNELMRAQAIIHAQVILTGDNGYYEVVNLPNPAGHRLTVSGAGTNWSGSGYDPYTDILAGFNKLASKGYTIDRMITGNDVRALLANNPQIRARIGRIVVTPGSNAVVNSPAGYVNLRELSDQFNADGMPAVELYDLQYRTQTSTGFFWDRGTFAMIATTGRDRNIDLGDLQPMPEPLPKGVAQNAGAVVLTNTIGYTAIGRCAGQSDPGRVINMFPKQDFPPRIEGEGIQTSFPVVTDPESIFVLAGIG